LFNLKVPLGIWEENNARESPSSFYNQVQQQRERGQQQAYEDDQQAGEEDGNGFVKPKANEKKDKKTKRAEEKKRAREAKKAAAAASNPNDYIPGMEGSTRPQDYQDDDDQQGPYVRKSVNCVVGLDHRNLIASILISGG
jgi:hypothetical protein